MARRTPRAPLAGQLEILAPAGACGCDLTSEPAAPPVGEVLLALESPGARDAVTHLAVVVHAAERWRQTSPGVYEPLPYRAPPEHRLHGVVVYAPGRDPEPRVLSRAQLAPVTRRLVSSPAWGPAFGRGSQAAAAVLRLLRLGDDVERSRILAYLRRWGHEARQRWGVPVAPPPPALSDRSLRRQGVPAGEARRLAEQISAVREGAPTAIFYGPLFPPPSAQVPGLDGRYTPDV